MPRTPRSSIVTAAALALLGCSAPASSSGHTRFARIEAHTARGPVHLRVELADRKPLMARGLMGRSHLDDDAGMLFVFPTERVHAFWMKNTLIPLDMLFLAPDGTVRAVVEREPLGLAPSDGGVASKYVLEVNRGWSRAHGIAPGARLQLVLDL